MNKIQEIAKVFFKLDTISFGGPATHIAMMEKEIVQKRNWVSEQHFLVQKKFLRLRQKII